MMSKHPAKKAIHVQAPMMDLLKDIKTYIITPNRGKEFVRHQIISQALGVTFYFPKPSEP